MPALQVRDFPDDLYERLKACAALEHRSVAQQTVALVEEGLNARNESHFWDGCELHRLGRAPQVIDFDTESARSARLCSRNSKSCRSSRCPTPFRVRQSSSGKGAKNETNASSVPPITAERRRWDNDRS